MDIPSGPGICAVTPLPSNAPTEPIPAERSGLPHLPELTLCSSDELDLYNSATSQLTNDDPGSARGRRFQLSGLTSSSRKATLSMCMVGLIKLLTSTIYKSDPTMVDGSFPHPLATLNLAK